MSGRPAAQEMAVLFGALVLFAVIVLIVAIAGAWAARRRGGSAIWLGLGYLVGGGLIAISFAAALVTPSYAYPGNFFSTGYFVAVGALFIAGGSWLAFRQKRDPNKAWFSGGLWLAVNSGVSAVVGHLLYTLDLVFIPVMLLAVSIGQWLLLRRTYKVSALWILGGAALSLGAFHYESPTVLFYLGSILYAVIGGVLLNNHNRTTAVVFGLGTLISWMVVAGSLEYITGPSASGSNSSFWVPLHWLMLSYFGMVIIWSSSVTGIAMSITINRSVKENNQADQENIRR